jgi:hypothetical protein
MEEPNEIQAWWAGAESQLLRRELAQKILSLHSNGNNITLSNITSAPWGTAYTDIKNTADGNKISSRDGDVELDIRMLRAILNVYDNFGPIAVSSIAGGIHSGNAHYEGRAADINVIRGRRVAETDDSNLLRAVHDFINTLGASRILYPLNDPVGHSTHFHMEWSTQ